MLRIVLYYGSGASSGFTVQNIKKAAGKKGMEIDVTARSESLIESSLVGTGIVLTAPHLIVENELVRECCQGVPAVVIDHRNYSMPDRNVVLTQLLDALK